MAIMECPKRRNILVFQGAALIQSATKRPWSCLAHEDSHNRHCTQACRCVNLCRSDVSKHLKHTKHFFATAESMTPRRTKPTMTDSAVPVPPLPHAHDAHAHACCDGGQSFRLMAAKQSTSWNPSANGLTLTVICTVSLRTVCRSDSHKTFDKTFTAKTPVYP